MMTINFYEKPTCSTCRIGLSMLMKGDIRFNEVDYYKTPFTHEKLHSLLLKMGMPARDLLRTKEKIYKDLNLATKDYSEDELIDFMIRYPDLIQRPIIEKGDEAILGRPPKKIIEFFDLKSLLWLYNQK